MNSSGSNQPPAAHASLKHPGRWLWLLLAIPVVLGLFRLRFDAEVFDLLPDDLPVVKGLKLYQEHFANARELILSVDASSPELAESAARTIAETLRANTDLVESVTWQPPWLEHPEQAAELIAYFWLNQSPDRFRQLAERLAPARLPVILNEARDQLASSMSPQDIGRLSYDPYGFTRLPDEVSTAAPSFAQGQELFASADGRFRILFVKARPDLRTYKQCQNWLLAVERTLHNVLREQPGPLRIGYTGRPAFVSEIASGMEHDMTTSLIGTAVIIAFLFWLAHRRLKPMLWLLALLTLILGCTLALGGLIFGTINVISIGFAAILLGLAVDYAVVHYQEALAQPHLSIPQIRHAIAPSIFWAAVTTISAFLVLNFGGLPGLGQLGSLVGLGVALAATIMIFEFLPPLFPSRRGPRSNQALNPATNPHGESPSSGLDEIQNPPSPSPTPTAAPKLLRLAVAMGMTVLLLAISLTSVVLRPPKLDTTANALRPRHSQAYETLDRIQSQLNNDRDPLWIIIRGSTVDEIGRRLDQVQSVLREQTTNGLVSDFTTPAMLWPNPSHQAQNRPTALALVAERATLAQAALTNGFASNALGLANAVLDTFQTAGNSPDPVFWPTNAMSRWIFEKLTARSSTQFFALGLVNPSRPAGHPTGPATARLIAERLPSNGVWLSGWQLLGSDVLHRVQGSMWKVVGPMAGLVLISLFLAFRRLPEILLSLAVLGLSGACVLTMMHYAGWSWNLLNLMAVPLVLGTGVDYSIFMQLALRRYHGDLSLAWGSVGRALLLCGGTAIAGFGALGLSTNAGMASLGRVCAAGIGCNMLIAVFLLPTWWTIWTRRFRSDPEAKESAAVAAIETNVPSSLYRSEFWRMGLFLARLVPARLLHLGAAVGVAIYFRLVTHRREIVVQNLLPPLDHDRLAAARTAAKLFQNFSRKLVDLWRFEAGLPIDHLLGATSGWEYFEQAQAQKRGILLLTPHLGNWEFGGPMLTGRGITLHVITLSEPGKAFTELRLASRAKWRIETLVIGNNPLAFVEIIKRLEQGGTVALLVDRPPSPTAVQVQLFGRPFDASIAAAELARASGCTLLPVHVPLVNGKYQAHILPPVQYQRAALRDRAARRDLTQRIIGSFEPLIRRHLDQWYHFVPIWPK